MPGGPRCPACGEPLFVWIETDGFGPREEEIVDRCENCGLVCARDRVPSDAASAIAELFPHPSGRELGRVANPTSFQAWLGAENWAALRPGGGGLAAGRDALRRLFAQTGRAEPQVRPVIGVSIAAMWQTLINLLTFHRDFAMEAARGSIHPSGFKGWSAWVIDLLISILVAAPTAILAVVLESLALLARRGGVLEVHAEDDPQRRP